MKASFRRLRPDGMAAQIALLMFIVIAIFQTFVTSTYLFRDPSWRVPVVEPGELIASALLAIDSADASARGQVLSELARTSPWVRFSVRDDAPPGSEPTDKDRDVSMLKERLWSGARVLVHPAPGADSRDEFVVALHKGGFAVVRQLEARRTSAPPNAGPSQGFWEALSLRIWERSAAFFFLCVAVLTVWLSGAVVAPLVKLARQAERFPDEADKFQPIVEDGPKEVRDLSRALNRMQGRIQAMIVSRSRALAAISHDLRTIITRIRLRSEFITDASLKAKMLSDAEIMDSMLHKNLLYLRGEQDNAERSLIDLDSVLQTIADQFSDMGHSVVYLGGEHQTVYGSLSELNRLFSNLVENAVTHGSCAVISAASPRKGFIEVEVADDGPGIPVSERARLLEPFARGEQARTMTVGSGFGLGLSIVKSLVEKAGGRLELANRSPQGLIARVALPAAFP